MRIRVVLVLVGVLVSVLVSGLVTAGSAWGAPPSTLEPGAVRAFLDRAVPEQLQRLQLPGASVAVVAGGRQVFAGGYGTADVETGRALDDRTPVPVDSISKVFTGTAVMQLVARGELHLHRDVNDYLTGFRGPDTYPGRPVTLAHLLTHTAGYEERNVGNSGTTPQPLGAHLAAHQPARVRPPGLLPSYSNYGLALAGHVVELRAAMPFERYAEENVFGPLGMTRSTFHQSDVHPLRDAAARSHRPEGTGNSPVPPSYDFLSPSGSAVASAADMARFMLAELQGDPRLLDDGPLRAMQDQQFAVDPRLPGMGFAFQRGVLGGHPMFGHDGDGLGSHSVMALFPTLGVGVFAAVNGDGTDIGGAAGLHELLRRFAGELLPPGPIDASTHPATYPAADAAPATELAGRYRYSRISTSDPSRLLARVLTDVQVEPADDGSLTTVGPVIYDLPDRVRWVPVGDRLYRADGRAELLAFGAGGVSLASGDDATVAWERVPWWQDTTLHLGLALTAAVGLLTTLAWPVAAIVRRRRAGTGAARLARWLAGAMALLITAFLAFAAWLAMPLDRFIDALIGGTSALTVLHALPLLAAVCGAGVLVSAALAWHHRWWSTAARLHYTAVALAGAAFLAVAWEYNFLTLPGA